MLPEKEAKHVESRQFWQSCHQRRQAQFTVRYLRTICVACIILHLCSDIQVRVLAARICNFHSSSSIFQVPSETKTKTKQNKTKKQTNQKILGDPDYLIDRGD